MGLRQAPDSPRDDAAPWRVDVEIGELVLDGFERVDRDGVAGAFCAELSRLLRRDAAGCSPTAQRVAKRARATCGRPRNCRGECRRTGSASHLPARPSAPLTAWPARETRQLRPFRPCSPAGQPRRPVTLQAPAGPGSLAPADRRIRGSRIGLCWPGGTTPGTPRTGRCRIRDSRARMPRRRRVKYTGARDEQGRRSG